MEISTASEAKWGKLYRQVINVTVIRMKNVSNYTLKINNHHSPTPHPPPQSKEEQS